MENTVEYIKAKIDFTPETAIILGSGLGGLADAVKNPIYIDYGELEGFPVSTAPGHMGRFVFGELSGKKVACMQGRFHFYEGYSMEQVVAGVRTLFMLGAKNLIVTNAAGGINTQFSVGDIMLITDHINFMGTNALIGKNDERFGVRFPDMSFAYNPELREIAEKCASELKTDIKKGVYLGCTGPSYETPAEIRAFRLLGADAVGMSTVPEVIAANHCKMRVLAFSLITNMAAGILKQPLTEEEVLETGARKGRELQRLIEKTVGEM